MWYTLTVYILILNVIGVMNQAELVAIVSDEEIL